MCQLFSCLTDAPPSTQVLVTLETKSACHVFSGFSDLIRPTRYRIASNSTSARFPAYHLSVGLGGSWFLVTKIFNERQLKDKKSLNSLCGTKNCFKPSVQLIESSFLLSGVRSTRKAEHIHFLIIIHHHHQSFIWGVWISTAISLSCGMQNMFIWKLNEKHLGHKLCQKLGKSMPKWKHFQFWVQIT